MEEQADDPQDCAVRLCATDLVQESGYMPINVLLKLECKSSLASIENQLSTPLEAPGRTLFKLFYKPRRNISRVILEHKGGIAVEQQVYDPLNLIKGNVEREVSATLSIASLPVKRSTEIHLNTEILRMLSTKNVVLRILSFPIAEAERYRRSNAKLPLRERLVKAKAVRNSRRSACSDGQNRLSTE